PFDIQRTTRHEMLEAFYRLGRADHLARAAAARVLLARLFIDLARGRRAADRAGVPHDIGLRLGRALVDDDIDDLGNDVPCPLDDDRVTDADILALADRQSVAVPAGDIVLVM